MIEETLRIVYAQPLNKIIFIMLVSITLWTVMLRVLEHRNWIRFFVNTVILVISLSAIIYLTLYHRGEGEYDLILTPFHSFIEAKIQPEMYRSMLMNVFLFEPLGLSLPGVLYKRKHSVMISILVGFLLSILIESIQYFYFLGRCEVDDVIMNTLGCFIGTTPYLLKLKWHLSSENK